jgi:hypothetical protein
MKEMLELDLPPPQAARSSTSRRRPFNRRVRGERGEKSFTTEYTEKSFFTIEGTF